MTKPIEYTDDLVIELCSRMAEGNSLRKVCEAEDMPTKSLVFKWLNIHEGFRDQYARAREALLAAHEQDIIELADDIPKNATAVDVAKAKLQIDSRKWLMSKIAPKQYGDKIETTVKGDKDSPLAIKDVTDRVLKAMPKEQLEAILEQSQDND